MRRIVTALVVGAGAFVLAGIAFVLVGRARASAERSRCQDNLRRICVSYLLEEAKSAQAFPAGTVVAGANVPPERRLSWVVPGLSGMGYGEVAASIDLASPWDAAANRSAAETFVVRLVCPALIRAPSAGPGLLHYPGMAGVGPDAATKPADAVGAGIFRYDAPTVVTDVKDGLSYTVMLIETADRPGPWIAGGPTSVRSLDPARRPYVGRERPFGGCHFGGANVAFADGSGRFVSDGVSADVLERLAGLADGGKPFLSNP